MFAEGRRVEPMTTPYATAPPEAPGRGAMVAEVCLFSMTSQFCGRAILRPAARSTVWKLELGNTEESETAGMLPAPGFVVEGASGNTAPFFLFSAVHWPDRKSTRLNSSHLGISYA